jgi:hypothetical protein
LKKRSKNPLTIGAALLRAARPNDQEFFAPFVQERPCFPEDITLSHIRRCWRRVMAGCQSARTLSGVRRWNGDAGMGVVA